VFKLMSFLVVFALTAGGAMVFDFKQSARRAGNADAEGLTFPEYISALPGRLSNLSSGAASAAGLPTRLADMLPKPPEGWKTRPVDAKDIDGFLPKSTKKADKTGIAALKAMAEGETDSGVEAATLTYEKGDRKLIIKVTRYPNEIFTSTAAMQQRMELQTMTAQFRGTEFATVRGLDVTEDLLPEGFRGRMFLADVGAQIHIRILAPKRMSDEDLVAFLDTLHVKAMNADVIDKVEGLGDVPVIVLASALEGEARDAYLADVAARADDEAEALAAERTLAEAAAQVEVPPADGGGFLGKLFGGGEEVAKEEETKADPAKVGCKTGKDGVKRCTIESAAPTE
jgi:hypothetical protein